MKLFESKVENEFREELRKSNEALQIVGSKLGEVLDLEGYEKQNAYILNKVPDQTGELYTLLIDGVYLLYVEIDKTDVAEVFTVKRGELRSYLNGLSKVNHIQLAVAQSLVRSK